MDKEKCIGCGEEKDIKDIGMHWIGTSVLHLCADCANRMYYEARQRDLKKKSNESTTSN